MRKHLLLLVFSTIVMGAARGQQLTDFTLTLVQGECEKGWAILKSSGITQSDSVGIFWSTGQTGVMQISGLDPGDYSVRIRVKEKKDTVTLYRDTTLYFAIEKAFCKVTFPKYFSPNGDNYNDQMMIGNVMYYPDFELEIFNKWGQRVHHQRRNFEPWDGKWLGFDLPDGVYYYIFLYRSSDTKTIAKGDITILR
jgi:gliding motility-associated-like protein